jgi:hypothetical protein
MDTIEALDTIPIELLSKGPPTDDIASGPILEVDADGVWIEVEPVVFEAWTGHRRKNGEEYHGFIVPLNGPQDGSIKYTGARACGCKTCQASVEPKFRVN